MFHHTAHPRTFDAAMRDTGAHKASDRVSAVRDLARHGAEHRAEVIERLRECLQQDEAAAVRAEAAVALADVGATEAVPALIARAERERTIEARQMVLAALGEIGDPRSKAVVRAALGDSAPAVRFQAVMAFVRICGPGDDSTRALLAATKDDDPLICHIALRMAEELGGETDDQPVALALLERALELLEHSTPEVKVASAIIVGRSGRDEGDEVLMDVAAGRVSTREAEDEAAAIELCGSRRLLAAKDALEQRAFPRRLSFRRDPFVWHARVALAAMHHPKAVEWVQRELGSASRERRTLAAAAAGRAGVTAARKQLLAMRRRVEGLDLDVVEEALRTLEAHEGTKEEE